MHQPIQCWNQTVFYFFYTFDILMQTNCTPESNASSAIDFPPITFANQKVTKHCVSIGNRSNKRTKHQDYEHKIFKPTQFTYFLFIV